MSWTWSCCLQVLCSIHLILKIPDILRSILTWGTGSHIQIESIASVTEVLLFLNILLEDLFRDKAKLQALCPRESLEWVEDLKNTHMKNLAKVQFSKYKKKFGYWKY